MEIKEHGVCVDKTRDRVQCNYCGKEMRGWHRLKCHLGGVGTDVTHCDEVTIPLRKTFQNMVKPKEPTTGLGGGNRVGQQVPKVNRLKRERRESVSLSGVKKEPSYKAQKCIARFFYENYFDFSAVESQGFKEMMRIGGGGEMEINSDDLNGWILKEKLKEVRDQVEKVKDLWSVTGCSILLDAWVDQKGHDLVTFVADCPVGPVYLKSFDVSGIQSDINALLSLVDGLLEEVGMHNVVQIIASSSSGWVGELGESFATNNTNVFWSVSVSHCFELLLEKIGKMDSFGEILDKVSNISEFINNDPLLLKRFNDMAASSEFEFVTPYLTLESVFKAKNMFDAYDWNRGGEEDTTISELVNDSSFWESVEIVMKSTSSLISGLLLFSNADNQHVGYIYDTMDGTKESIAKEFDNEESRYKPLWDVIDDVWNKHLYSPLHAAGYFLNPTSFYSTDFHLDPEVATGLTSSLVRMVKECDVQVKVSKQLEMYRLGKECFDEASQADQITGIAPAEWWDQKASQFPELQSFAVKILSQTCEGASRFKLKRGLAEKLLLAEGKSRQKQLEDLAFVHYNLHLQRCNKAEN